MQVAEVKVLACTRPADVGAPLERWSTSELAAHATREGTVEAVSASTVSRWLATDAIRPWQHRSWIFTLSRPAERMSAGIRELAGPTPSWKRTWCRR